MGEFPELSMSGSCRVCETWSRCKDTCFMHQAFAGKTRHSVRLVKILVWFRTPISIYICLYIEMYIYICIYIYIDIYI